MVLGAIFGVVVVMFVLIFHLSTRSFYVAQAKESINLFLVSEFIFVIIITILIRWVLLWACAMLTNGEAVAVFMDTLSALGD